MSKDTLSSYCRLQGFLEDAPLKGGTGGLLMPTERPAKVEAGYSPYGFFDIHCHILPKLDEGPQTVEESLRMLELARNDGISGIVATPHVISGIYNNTKESIGRAVSELRASANHIEIYSGAEIRINRDLVARADRNELPLINGNNFVLLELPTYVIPPLNELEKIVKSLRSGQINPIFAHPERNVPIMKDFSIMERLARCGALFQMTAMSVTDRSMRGSALRMIRKGFVHVIASDAHDSRRRPPILSAAYKMVSKKFDLDLANELFVNNPLKIVRGENVSISV